MIFWKCRRYPFTQKLLSTYTMEVKVFANLCLIHIICTFYLPRSGKVMQKCRSKKKEVTYGFLVIETSVFSVFWCYSFLFWTSMNILLKTILDLDFSQFFDIFDILIFWYFDIFENFQNFSWKNSMFWLNFAAGSM